MTQARLESDLAKIIYGLVKGIKPFDQVESDTKTETLRWIASGAPLFRTAPPATPDPHLCCYLVPVDQRRRTVLLLEHIKAGRWIPPGGHVDLDEDPRVTVVREAFEELGINGRFHPRFGDRPLFVTACTIGKEKHTDVSLWFVLDVDQATTRIELDLVEARQARWFALDGPQGWDGRRFDPRMGEFCAKVLTGIDGESGNKASDG